MFMMNNCCINNRNNTNDCSYTPTGINAQFGYNTTSNEDASCACKQMLREEMLKKIRCLKFAIVDIAQYLNTHPEDEKAICLHKEYCNQCKELEDKYQKVYGPLSIYFPCNKWRWLENPWPWEGSEM